MNQIRAVDLKSLNGFPDDILTKLHAQCSQIEEMMTSDVSYVFESIAEGKLPLRNISEAKEMLIALKQLGKQEWFSEYEISNLFDSYSIGQIIQATNEARIICSRKETVILVEKMLSCILNVFKETIPFVVDQEEIKLVRDSLDTLKHESNPITDLVDIVYYVHSMAKWMGDTSKSIQKTGETEEILKAFGIKTAFLCEGMHGYWTTGNQNRIDYENERKTLSERLQELMLSDSDNASVLHRIHQMVSKPIMAESIISTPNNIVIEQNASENKREEEKHNDLTDDLIDDLLAF